MLNNFYVKNVKNNFKVVLKNMKKVKLISKVY